jgi:hypothetical protein
MDGSRPEAEEGELQIVCRVIKADLLKNFEAFGKMDPFATVELQKADGAKIEVGRTRTDWNAHMNPVWNHTFPGQPYVSSDKLIVSVFEDDVVGSIDLMGIATTPVVELLGATEDNQEVTGSVRELSLLHSTEVTGKVALQVMLVRRLSGRGSTSSANITRIGADVFESPVHRLGVSGGTAPFFTLKLLQPSTHETPGFYIGKDLSHATDEIMFYEQMKDVLAGPGGSAMAPLLSFCFQYKGVVSTAIADAKPNDPPKDLIALRNLFDGAEKLRLLDIKIGQKTADAGWQGKSKMAAMRQSLVDGVTNSAQEGFRLEGFDGQPPAVTSMDPLLDLSHIKESIADGKKLRKKAFRYMLQRLQGQEMLSFFLDVHQEPKFEEAKLETVRSPLEYSEIVLSEIVKRLVRLSIACRLMVVPQKWIGSSVALAFDGGHLPARSTPEAEIREAVKVHIFDWGRSELNSLQAHEQLSEKDAKDRAKFWTFYVGGIDRLAFEAARFYHNRFGNSGEWHDFLCVIQDFDSLTSHDVLGMVMIPLKVTKEAKLTLHDSSGKKMKTGCCSGRPAATITYSLQWRSYPAVSGQPPSRLAGAWQFTVLKANHLPRSDRMLLGQSTSDPFVQLIAMSKDGKHIFRQQTSCKCRELDPVFNETLEVPTAAKPQELEATLQTISPGLAKEISRFFPPEVAAVTEVAAATKWTKLPSPQSFLSDDQAVEGWVNHLDTSVENLEALEPFFTGKDDANDDVVKEARTLSKKASEDLLKEMKQIRSDRENLTASLKEVAEMNDKVDSGLWKSLTPSAGGDIRSDMKSTQAPSESKDSPKPDPTDLKEGDILGSDAAEPIAVELPMDEEGGFEIQQAKKPQSVQEIGEGGACCAGNGVCKCM